MTAEQIKALPAREKVRIMELIWEDFRDHFEQSEIQETHKRLLDERRARVANGSARLLNWDAVKDSLGNR